MEVDFVGNTGDCRACIQIVPILTSIKAVSVCWPLSCKSWILGTGGGEMVAY